MARRLAVLLYGRRIGTLCQTDSGRHLFEYADEPGTTPLSVAMPFVLRRHGHKAVEPFLDGLLPDNESVRLQTGDHFGVSGRNPFALLEHIGMDCAGAVQFCAEGEVDAALAGGGTIRPLTRARVAGRLRRLRGDAGATWITDLEEWSLAGAQPKIALRRTAAGWAEVSGGEPTTHILKPGIPALRASALNEHVCLRAVSRLGLPAASVEYDAFDGEDAIVVERYDRLVLASGAVRRIHQEDICQALGVYPASKYEVRGGPSAARVIRLLDDVAQPGDPGRFVDYLAVSYLLGAPDSHAKNFSLLELAGRVELAPLYDVASALPYDPARDERQDFAFSIGGERRFGAITDRHWSKLAASAGMEDSAVIGRVHAVAEALPDALHDVLAEAGRAADDLGSRLLPRVQALCAWALSPQPVTGDVWAVRPGRPGRTS